MRAPKLARALLALTDLHQRASELASDPGRLGRKRDRLELLRCGAKQLDGARRIRVPKPYEQTVTRIGIGEAEPMIQPAGVLSHPRRVHRRAIEVTRQQGGFTDHGQEPLQRPDDVPGTVRYGDTCLADADCLSGIARGQIKRRETHVGRNDRRNVERAFAGTLDRSSFFGVRNLPRQIEVLLCSILLAAPQVNQTRPYVQPWQEHPLVEGVSLTYRSLRYRQG